MGPQVLLVKICVTKLSQTRHWHSHWIGDVTLTSYWSRVKVEIGSSCVAIFISIDKKHLKNVGPIRHCEPFYIAIHQVSLLSHAACASMSTTMTTTTTTTTMTTRDRGDRYGPIEWAQLGSIGVGPPGPNLSKRPQLICDATVCMLFQVKALVMVSLTTNIRRAHGKQSSPSTDSGYRTKLLRWQHIKYYLLT